MKLPGVITNVTAFGAFVDVGVHQDGLVHISHLADTFVKDPNGVVKVGQRVHVTVLEVDLERKRIALSLKSRPEIARSPRSGEPAATLDEGLTGGCQLAATGIDASGFLPFALLALLALRRRRAA